MKFTIHGKEVPVYGDDVTVALNSRQFKDWVAGLDPRFSVQSIEFQSVDINNRGGNDPHVRFLKFSAQVLDTAGKKVGGIVFMRGGSVAILIVLECEGKEYTVLTSQRRFPVGNYNFLEIPAGTLEGDTFVGGAARELKEETGIEIKESELIDLVSLFCDSRHKGVFATPGGSDEYFRLFAYRRKVDREYLSALEGKCTGLASENEQITLKVILLDRLIAETADAKTYSAYLLYLTAKLMKKM